MTSWVKVCCIESVEEAEIAAFAGADAVGLVSAMPSGPGSIPESRIAEIAVAMRGSIETVLLTSREEPEAIVRQHERCGCDTIQLCAPLASSAAARLRALIPDTKLIAVVHVLGEEALARAEACAEHADAILLDSGSLESPARELGGTGRPHDWGLSRRIVESLDVPVLLAGGLNPHNVTYAIAEVDPWGVDVCSGLRTDDRFDPHLLRDFMAALKQ